MKSKNNQDRKRCEWHRVSKIHRPTLRLPKSQAIIDALGAVRQMNGRQVVGVDAVKSKVAVLKETPSIAYDQRNSVSSAGSKREGARVVGIKHQRFALSKM